jgi:choline dehydrogenase-like flavoprotein
VARSYAAAIRRAHEIIHDAVEPTGLGRVEGRLTETDWPDDLSWGWHHMGTTRMHDDPKQGVVDKNCKVHGI